MKKKILITGAVGFIGFYLTKFLLKKNFKVIGVDNINNYYSKKLKLGRLEILSNFKNFFFYKKDITNQKDLEKIFVQNKPHTVRLSLCLNPRSFSLSFYQAEISCTLQEKQCGNAFGMHNDLLFLLSLNEW